MELDVRCLPYLPFSHGIVERTVQAIKSGLKKVSTDREIRLFSAISFI